MRVVVERRQDHGVTFCAIGLAVGIAVAVLITVFVLAGVFHGFHVQTVQHDAAEIPARAANGGSRGIQLVRSRIAGACHEHDAVDKGRDDLRVGDR